MVFGLSLLLYCCLEGTLSFSILLLIVFLHIWSYQFYCFGSWLNSLFILIGLAGLSIVWVFFTIVAKSHINFASSYFSSPLISSYMHLLLVLFLLYFIPFSVLYSGHSLKYLPAHYFSLWLLNQLLDLAIKFLISAIAFFISRVFILVIFMFSVFCQNFCPLYFEHFKELF